MRRWIGSWCRARSVLLFTCVAVVVLGWGTVSAPVIAGATSYVRRIASMTGASSTRTTAATLTVGAAGVQRGDAVLGSALFSSTTSLTGPVSIIDSVGNRYHIDRDVNDGTSKDRLVSFSATSVTAVPPGTSVTLTFPPTIEYHIALDEFVGIGAVDQSAGASGTTSAWSSGSVNALRSGEIV